MSIKDKIKAVIAAIGVSVFVTLVTMPYSMFGATVVAYVGANQAIQVFSNSVKVTQIIVTATNNNITAFQIFDTPTSAITNIFPAYTNFISYASNVITSYTNYYGVVNSFTNTNALVDATNFVSATTTFYPNRVSATIPTNGSITFQSVNYYFQNGLLITNTGGGIGTYTITYQQ